MLFIKIVLQKSLKVFFIIKHFHQLFSNVVKIVIIRYAESIAGIHFTKGCILSWSRLLVGLKEPVVVLH